MFSIFCNRLKRNIEMFALLIWIEVAYAKKYTRRHNMRLLPKHEFVGFLSEIRAETQQIQLIFSILKEIEIPLDTISFDELHKLVGKRVGIVNVEDQFFIRKI